MGGSPAAGGARRGWTPQLAAELGGFATVGAVCFVIDVGLFQLIYLHTGAGPVLAKLASALAATTAAYLGNRYWSFAHRAHPGMRREYLIFVVINGGALLLGLAVVALVRHGLHQHSVLVLQAANVSSIALGTVLRYVGYRRWVFSARLPAPGAAGTSAGPAADLAGRTRTSARTRNT